MRRLNVSQPTFAYDPEDPEGFRSGMFRLGTELGARDTGTTVYELPPGQALCPYHYEYGEEEWLMALEGHPSLRTPDGVGTLEPFDVVFFPKGPEGAHQVFNDSDATVRILMWSTNVLPTATAYPDSGKVGVWTGDRAEDLMARRADGVGYFEGESGRSSSA
jgi:uncharacterized cupin superfamily protein